MSGTETNAPGLILTKALQLCQKGYPELKFYKSLAKMGWSGRPTASKGPGNTK